MLMVEVKLVDDESLLKERITPGGTPALRRTTVPPMPETSETAIEKLKLPPCKTSPVVAEGLSTKSNGGVAAVWERVVVLVIDVARVVETVEVDDWVGV